jgi:hypothetical protein
MPERRDEIPDQIARATRRENAAAQRIAVRVTRGGRMKLSRKFRKRCLMSGPSWK